MPIYEYDCPAGHRLEKFFTTFSEAEKHEDKTKCAEHNRTARRVQSVPLPGHFYGDPAGYDRPSPTKRYSTKLATQKGNEHSAG